MASVCFLSPQIKCCVDIEEGQKMTRVSGLSRNLNSGWEGPQNLYSINPYNLQTRVTNPKKIKLRKKLPLICSPWIKVKWSLSSFVPLEISQRFVVCHTKAFPFSTTTLILTINYRRRMMLQAFYVFSAHML